MRLLFLARLSRLRNREDKFFRIETDEETRLHSCTFLFFFSLLYWNLLFFHCIRERKNTKAKETSVEKDPAVCWCAVIRKLVRTGVSSEVKSFDSTAAEGRSRHGSPSIRIVANLIFYVVDTWGWITFFVVQSSWRHRRSSTAAMMETWGFWNIVHSIDAVPSLSTINDVSSEWIFLQWFFRFLYLQYTEFHDHSWLFIDKYVYFVFVLFVSYIHYSIQLWWDD